MVNHINMTSNSMEEEQVMGSFVEKKTIVGNVDLNIVDENKKTGDTFSKNSLLTLSLIEYFKDPVNFNVFLSIIEGQSTLSLRILDWFVTNHAKKDNIMYTNKGAQFIVYLNYKSQLKAYSKRQFDPFCRRDRITLNYDYQSKDSVAKTTQVIGTMTTTVGQLNFFRWALINNVIDYVMENLETIEHDMYQSCRRNQNKKKRSASSARKRRTELSKSATKSISKHPVSVTVSFD